MGAWEQEHGSRSMGAGAWAQEHGSRSMGAGAWEQEHGSRSIDWAREIALPVLTIGTQYSPQYLFEAFHRNGTNIILIKDFFTS